MKQKRESAKVVEMRPNAIVRVVLDDGRSLDCHLSGNQRTALVRLVPGDEVTVEISPLDPSRGRIVGDRPEGRSGPRA